MFPKRLNVDTLQTGLSKTLATFPIVAGQLEKSMQAEVSIIVTAETHLRFSAVCTF
jgi:hypothetical protein